MSRKAEFTRTTQETDIRIELDLDGRGQHEIKTPLPFLTHMVEQLSRHGLFDLKVDAKGDTEIDGHHTTEDLGITLGRTFAKALGQRVGIRRYGWATLPMDEARVTCSLDLSGRPFFLWRVPMPKTKIGQFDTELAEVFFEGFARGAECNLHLVLEEGENLHHIVEITFKAFAKALRIATEIDPRAPDTVPSTKGTLTE